METPRETLITAFSDGKSPTGSQFRLLIDSIISRDDDGINKTKDTPLKVMAGLGTQASVLSLCPKDVLDPQWIISLKALNALGAVAGQGLNIGQGDNPANPVVYLDHATSKVGLGTNQPTAQLEVMGDVNGEVGSVVNNVSEGLAAYSAHILRTRDGNGVLFKNSNLRTADGGPGAMTLRNDVGDLRLLATGSKGIILKQTTGFTGVNKEIPERQLDLSGELGMNGNSIHFQTLSGHVSNLGKVGMFWHGMNNGGNPYNYGIYKVDGAWTAPIYQQLRLAWETGIELSPGTGAGTGYTKSYVDVTTGKGLMVSSGNLGVGTVAPLGKAHIALAPWDGDQPLLTSWTNSQVVIGADANGGGIGMGFHATGQKGYLISAQPGVGYKDLSIKALQLIFSANGAEQVRIQADGRIGMGTNAPTAHLHVRRDVDATSGIRYTNASAGVNANAIIALQTDSSEGILYKNSSTRTTNGGINAMTLQNLKGDLRLYAESTSGVEIKGATGRVGIGTTNPASLLSVAGNLTIGANRAGTAAAPTNGLLVEGESIFSSTVQFQSNLRVGTSALGTSGSVELVTGLASPQAGKLIFGADNTGWRFAIAKKVGGTTTDLITAVDSGHVGIGTADPKGRLDLVGGALVINTGFGNDVARPVVSTLRNAGEIAAYSGYSYASDDGFLRLSAGGGGSASFKSYIDISGHSTIPDMNSNIVLGTGGVERLRINGQGNVGIGTNPQGRLDIAGGAILVNSGLTNSNDRPAISSTRITGEMNGYSGGVLAGDDGFLRLSAGGGTSAGAKTYIDLSGFSTKADMNRNIVLGTAGAERMRIDSSGYVGINTPAPATRLHVASTGRNIFGHGILIGKLDDAIKSTALNGDVLAVMDIGFTGYRDSVPNQIGAKISAVRIANYTGTNAHLIQATELAFYTGDGAPGLGLTPGLTETCSERLRISKDGKIGIGTTNPNGRLEVVGGSILTTSGFGNATARPAVSNLRIAGEIGSYSGGGLAGDDGFLRLSAGGGSGGGAKSFIDISGYSTIPDMNNNIVLGTAGAERMRIALDGSVSIGSVPTAHLLYARRDANAGVYNLTHNPNTGSDAYTFLGMQTDVSHGFMFKNSSTRLSDGGPHTMTVRNDKGDLRLQAEGAVGWHLKGTSGWLGFGTTIPRCPLDVQASANSTISYYYLAGSGTGYSNGNVPISIWSTGRIVAPEFNALSDQRIKENIAVSNGAKDLDMLRQIEVVDYTYIDHLARGGQNRKGVLAQDVAGVMPDAVNIHPEVVPSIYARPAKVDLKDGVLTLTMDKNHELTTGEEVRVYSKNGFAQKAVTVKNKKTFVLEGWEYDTEEVFVYGKLVDDFMVVDYNRLFTLGLSATQELHRQLEEVKAENALLRSELAEIKEALKRIGA